MNEPLSGRKEPVLKDRRIGETSTSAIGLGAMHFSFADPVDDTHSISTIHAALDAGITLIDTALAYTTVDHVSHNEALIADALRKHPDGDSVFIATKGGHYRSGTTFPKDARPEALRADCEQSLRMLGRDTIDLYQLHWPDPNVPISDSVGALAELRSEGKIQHIGMCNVSIDELTTARSITTIAAVQNSFSVFNRNDQEMLDTCQRDDIAYLCYSPLGGKQQATQIGRRLPAFAEMARDLDISTQRLALAWLLAQSTTVIPIPGTRRAVAIVDSARAADVELQADQLDLLTNSLTDRDTEQQS